MSIRDSLTRAILDGKGDIPSAHTEHTRRRNLLRKSWQSLKSGRQTGLIGWIFLFSLAMTAFSAYLAESKTSKGESRISLSDVPETATGMAVLLRSKLPGSRIVSTRADGQIDRSFILTAGNSDEDALRKLPRVSDCAEQWRDTVMCEWLRNWQPAELFLEEWGENGLALPPFVFFGDKELLAKIKEALR